MLEACNPTEADTPRQPKELVIALILFIGSAAVSVFLFATMISRIGDLNSFGSDAARQDPQLNATETTVLFYLLFGLIFGIWALGIVASIIFPILAFRGRNWARVLSTVVAGCSLIAPIMGGLFGLVVTGAALVGMILMWAKESNLYFRAVKARVTIARRTVGAV